MTRNPIQTVTSIPVLVDAEGPWDDKAKRPYDADGWLIYYPSVRTQRSVTVRIASSEAVRKRLRTIFPKPEDIALFSGALGLKSAYETGDELLFQRHFEAVRSWIEVKIPGVHTEWAFGSPKKPNWRLAVQSAYSLLINRLILDARPVMWYCARQRALIPAVYCPDWKTAAFVTILVNELRVCPKCNTVFVPTGIKNFYCCPEHREAHRMARKRWRDKHAN